MKRFKFLMMSLLMTTMMMVNPIQKALADDDTMAVSVDAILPDNQHNKDVTYYDLRMKPGQKQELEFKLINPSDRDEKVKLKINNGTTNDSGTIDYSDRGEDYKRDNTLQLALEDVATIPEEVTVKANSTEIVKIQLDMPEEEFKGVIIGGIFTTKADDEDTEDSSKGGGMQIKNKIGYTIGLNLSESDDEVNAELGLLKVFPGQTSGRNVVKANIQNNQPQVLEDIEYYGEVTKKGSSEVLHKATQTSYRFAPNSNFNYDISWESQPFQAGDYTLNMTAESKDTGQTWNWTEDFTITSKEAKELNKKAIDLDKNNTLLYIIIGVSLVVVIIIIYLIIRKVKANKEEKRRQELKKKKRNNRKKNKSKSKK